MVFWVSNSFTDCCSGFAVHTPGLCCWAGFFPGVSACRWSMIGFSAFGLALTPVDYSVFRSMETFGLFHSSQWAHASSVAKSISLILPKVCASRAGRNRGRVLRAHLPGWSVSGSGRHSPARLNLPGAGFLLGLDSFDVITWDIVSRGIFFLLTSTPLATVIIVTWAGVLQIQQGTV